jgi:hypothetical protein
MKDKLTIFVERLNKIGIKLELVSNYPWVYLYKVNGNLIKEKHYSDSGFTIGFLPIINDTDFKFISELDLIFNVIRKYL